MRTVSGLFDTYDEVTATVDALSDLGVASSDITVVSPQREPAVSLAQGAGLGAAIGGVGGILAGLSAFAIPGLGTLIGVGWLVPALLGATAGGLAGGVVSCISSTGIDEQDAHVYAEAVRRGSTIVAARVHDDEARKIIDIFRRCGAIDTNARRSEYASGGWDGFVSSDIWDEDIGSEDSETPPSGDDRST